MNVIAFIAMLIAAIIFVFIPDGPVVRLGNRSGVCLGLFFLTVGLIFQFASKTHAFHF